MQNDDNNIEPDINLAQDNTKNSNSKKYKKIVETYTTQSASLPDYIQLTCNEKTNNEEVKAYAYLDLNKQFQLAEAWIIVTENHLLVTDIQHNAIKNITIVKRAEIDSTKINSGLSCSTLSIKLENKSPIRVRYSHRQRKAVSLLNKHLKKTKNTKATDPDFQYLEATSDSIRNAQASVNLSRLTVVRRLLSYLKPYKKQLILGMSGAVLMTILTLITPFVTKYLIDDIFHPYKNGNLSLDQALALGKIIVISLVIIFTLREFSHWIRLRTMSILGEYVARDIRKELYSHMQKLNMNFYSKNQTGSLISRVSNDTDRLWDFLAFGVVEVTLSIIMLVGLSIVLIVLDWRLGLLVIAPIPILLWSFKVHSNTLARLFTRAWRKWSRITEVLSDTIPGIRVVKAFSQEKKEKARFDECNDSCVTEFSHIHRVWTKFWPKILLSLHLLVVVVWLFALPRLIQPADAELTPLTIGTFLVFLMYLNMFFQPMETLGMLMRMINRATSSANRVFEILDTQPEIKVVSNPIKIEKLKGNVSFNNVSFSYDSMRTVLQNINFEVKAGEMIGLVGESGAGKSTITNLIARFYLPTSGKILIDGIDISQVDISTVRKQMGMVLQDPFLFHGTILDNIRYGNQDKSLSEVIEAGVAANAHDFICKLPFGYETIVGERGHTLSGGERQRISIARAILTNPQILILDEATSSVDTKTERKIQDALDSLIENRTVFAIAHRLSTLRQANRILVLDKGEIVEQGTHTELLEKEKGIYHKLVELQHQMQNQHFV